MTLRVKKSKSSKNSDSDRKKAVEKKEIVDNNMIVEHPLDNSEQFVNNHEKEDDDGRLEKRIPAPWEQDEADTTERKISRNEERKKRKSLKMKTKEKIGNIDVNVLQKELCESIFICCFYKVNIDILVRGDDIFEAEHLPSYARTYILPRQMVSYNSCFDFILHFS